MKKKIIIYDFDGTLTPYPITKFGILDKCGFVNGVYDPRLKEIIAKSKAEGKSLYEAVYSCFLKVIKECGFEVNDENLSLGAEELEYNVGVFDYFGVVKRLGVKNYLISSGIKVLLEKTLVSKYFDKIYATTFKYKNGEAVDTEFLMSDKKKVDIIKEIMSDNGLDDCSDVVYIGDGLTDLYAMEYVNNHGGVTIFVYLEPNNKELVMAKKKNFVNLFTLADYSRDSELYNYIISLMEE